MKYYLPLLLFFLGINSSKAQKMVFESTKHNFGYLQRGDVDTIIYKFKNEGGAPLIITDTKVECSCTKVEFPHDPVPPGAGGEIIVIYDSKGAIGYQDRVVSIISNSKKGDSKIHFKGDVIAKKKTGF
jgi:hypothetical protein